MANGVRVHLRLLVQLAEVDAPAYGPVLLRGGDQAAVPGAAALLNDASLEPLVQLFPKSRFQARIDRAVALVGWPRSLLEADLVAEEMGVPEGAVEREDGPVAQEEADCLSPVLIGG